MSDFLASYMYTCRMPTCPHVHDNIGHMAHGTYMNTCIRIQTFRHSCQIA
jgi:hypothetical protein